MSPHYYKHLETGNHNILENMRSCSLMYVYWWKPMMPRTENIKINWGGKDYPYTYRYIASFEVQNISEWTILLVMFIWIMIFNTWHQSHWCICIVLRHRETREVTMRRNVPHSEVLKMIRGVEKKEDTWVSGPKRKSFPSHLSRLRIFWTACPNSESLPQKWVFFEIPRFVDLKL